MNKYGSNMVSDDWGIVSYRSQGKKICKIYKTRGWNSPPVENGKQSVSKQLFFRHLIDFDLNRYFLSQLASFDEYSNVKQWMC